MMNSPAITPQKIFPFVAIVIGLLYVFITPPFQAPDETNHFYRIIQVAQGQFIPEKRGNETGGVIPKSVVRVGESFIYKIIHNPENKIPKVTFENAFRQPLNPEDTIYFSFPNSSLYSPASYLPQLLFIAPGLCFDLPPIWLMYGGRISSALISVLLLSLAIRQLPAFHWSFFAVVMLPMFCYQMASLSADAFLNSLSMLLWALAIRVSFVDKTLTVKTALKIFLVTVLLAGCKAGYLFLTLFFLLPVFTLTDKTKKRQWLLFTATLFLCSLVISLAWSTVVKATFSPYGNPDINPDAAIAFIKSNPLQFAAMVVKNIFRNIPFYFYGVVGYLGWLDTKIPLLVTMLYTVMLVAVVYAENKSQFDFSCKQHLLVFCVAALTGIIIIVSQYIVTTPAGSMVIERSQGRYFLPIVLPLLFIIRIKQFAFFTAKLTENNIKWSVPSLSICTALYTFFTILNRYYY